MINCNILSELKARKAKFGFKYDGVKVSSYIPLGKLMESLQNNYTAQDYSAELAGMHATDFRLYTDNDTVADFVRTNFCIKLQKISMAIKYHFIGWCKEDNHDKIWGIIQLTETANGYHNWSAGDFVTVWGRRGKAMQTKIYKDTTSYSMSKLSDKKLYKSKPEECYTEIDVTKLAEVYPEFEQDLKETAFWSKLKL